MRSCKLNACGFAGFVELVNNGGCEPRFGWAHSGTQVQLSKRGATSLRVYSSNTPASKAQTNVHQQQWPSSCGSHNYGSSPLMEGNWLHKPKILQQNKWFAKTSLACLIEKHRSIISRFQSPTGISFCTWCSRMRMANLGGAQGIYQLQLWLRRT